MREWRSISKTGTPLSSQQTASPVHSCAGDDGEGVCPVIAPAREQPSTTSVPPEHHAIAIPFDLMQPIGPLRRLARRGGSINPALGTRPERNTAGHPPPKCGGTASRLR